MDVREKLMELLVKASHECDDFYDLWDMRQCADEIASFLIAHGVTVQEWISIQDKLPKADGTKVIVTNGVCSWEDLLGVYDKWVVQSNSSLKKHKKPVTHWQPMPQPPKGE